MPYNRQEVIDQILLKREAAQVTSEEITAILDAGKVPEDDRHDLLLDAYDKWQVEFGTALEAALSLLLWG